MRALLLLSMLVFTVSCATGPSIKSNPKSSVYTKGSRSLAKKKVSTWTKCSTPKKEITWKSWVETTNTCAKKGQWGRVKLNAGLMLEKFPNSPWGTYFYSLEALEKGQLARAEWMIEKSISMSGDVGIFFYQKARVLSQQGENGIARQAFARAYSLDNSLSSAASYLATMAFRDQDFESSLSYLDGVNDDDKSMDLWIVEMESSLFKENFTRALKASSFLTKNYTQNVTFQLRHAHILEQFPEKRKEALQAYQKIHKSLKKRGPANKIAVNLPDKITSLKNTRLF